MGQGHEVRTQCLGDLSFDPILWKGYKEIQELEPDLKYAQECIKWSDKWVIIYPIWWGSVPALLKGFMDRTLYSGFAYKYHKGGFFWISSCKADQGLSLPPPMHQPGGYGGNTETAI
ncbi:MAG: NAD(P)H-dependent oxidoreductase [Cyclobacteriaceae bacterium]